MQVSRKISILIVAFYNIRILQKYLGKIIQASIEFIL